MNVALAQLRIDPLDPAATRAVTVAAITTAAAGGADLVVLPELASCGYVLAEAGLREVAEPEDGSGPVLSAWCDTAARYGVAVVGGFAELSGDALFNSAVAIGPAGDVVGVYRKLHLFAGERDVFAPGDLGLPIFRLGGASVGVLICYDLRFVEAMRILAVGGAELVAVPTAWVNGFDRRPAHVDGVLAQANLNQVFVACAAQVGPRFLGRSVLAGPYGDALAGPLDAADEDVHLTRIDIADARLAQDRGPGISPRANRRVDVYDSHLGYREVPR
jgi:N-carbamoylputrescine amidase